MAAKRKQRVKSQDNKYSWLIAYIDRDFIHLVNDQLSRNPEYEDVEAYIPTVKILKKQFKGKDHFDDVPLLFNYGFFKIPRKLALHADFLENMQKSISCIYGWVKDPMKVRRNTERQLRGDQRIYVATASPDEIAELVKSSVNIGAHTADDLTLINKGDVITLRGYPFDGVEAEFIELDEKRGKVKVNIILFSNKKEVTVSVDNVFFTIYHNKNYDDKILFGNDSLDKKADNKTLDKFLNKHQPNAD